MVGLVVPLTLVSLTPAPRGLWQQEQLISMQSAGSEARERGGATQEGMEGGSRTAHHSKPVAPI